MTKKSLISILVLSLLFFICLQSTFCQSEIVKTIYFKSNSFQIDKKCENSLNRISDQLRSDSFGYLKIFGYTDTKGTESNNDILSEKRATAIYNYLKSHSVFDTTKVYVAWLGESGDVYDLHFPMAHIQQKCVDIWIQFRRTNRDKAR